jgi:L,D-transpeptidase catalytic domain
LPISRRLLLATGVASLATGIARPIFALPAQRESSIGSALLRRALGALMQHHAAIAHHDTIGIADFSLPSSMPRFHVLNLGSGTVSSHLVAHGRGSDPAHTGWLERFSNEPQSHATSAGTYKTDDIYFGGHGRSLRLEGLDQSNSNAAARAIVVHGAPYVSTEILLDHGVLGRSLGCFALANSSLGEVLTRLGSGRMIYADKV